MKAILQKKYGSPNSLAFADVAAPTPRDNEILVRVHASSVNAADVDQVRGPLLIRIGAPLRPKYKIPGSDIAGVVAAIGSEVSEFKVGDEVFGDLTEAGFGAFAEYACAPADALAMMPGGLSFEQMATVPSAAIVAVQGLRDYRPVEPGQHVLINGAGGGMGTFGVQLAKYLGAEVTGVDSAEKAELLQSIGADHVLDYRADDFTLDEARYDLVLDMVGNHAINDVRRALTSTGAYVLVGGPVSRFLQLQLRSAQQSDQKLAILMWKPFKREDVEYLSERLTAGDVKPIIDRRYPLREAPSGLLEVEAGNVLGKAVITV